MSAHPKLFTPIRLGGIELANRIVVSPMCQYSATDGTPGDWHLMHLGQFAISGAGLTVVEATAVTPEGRISKGCTGLYSDENESAMKRAVAFFKALTPRAIGVQLAHAGRKGSARFPWQGGKPLAPEEGAWETVAPSPIAFGEGWPSPRELSGSELPGLVASFVKAAERAKRVGFDAIEVHASHGYLLHQFLSPLTNRRSDTYGRDRMKFPLEVAAAL